MPPRSTNATRPMRHIADIGVNSQPSSATSAFADIAHVWPLLGRPVAMHTRLVELTGSIKAALMLSQAIYWTRHGKGVREGGGWFFKSMQQGQRETGLS